MTAFFIARLFEEHATLKPALKTSELQSGSTHSAPSEMSLEDFSDFVLAWEHRSTDLGMRYFFPVFDLRQAGRISQVVHDVTTIDICCSQGFVQSMISHSIRETFGFLQSALTGQGIVVCAHMCLRHSAFLYQAQELDKSWYVDNTFATYFCWSAEVRPENAVH